MKERRQYLYSLVPDAERTANYKAVCGSYLTFLEKAGATYGGARCA